jgi:undecaprenyl-diphosphatase
MFKEEPSMSRVVSWLLHHENQLFFWVNRRLQHAVLDRLFGVITHLGGATATILTCLGVAIVAEGPLRSSAWQALIALVISHIPVAWVKKKYPRQRPYLTHSNVNFGKNPLKDHSFPSGHSTAIFAVVVPFVCFAPASGIILFPLAATVSLSRIYLGLHYPSDCLAGSLLGSCSALLTVALIG